MIFPRWRNKFGVLPIRVVRRGWRSTLAVAFGTIRRLPHFHFIDGYREKQGPITLSTWFMQKIVGINREAYWGMHFTSKAVNPKRILVGVDSNPGIEPSCYIQGSGEVRIGDYTQVAMNVSIISGNHDLYDLDKNVPDRVSIGSYCWLGAGVIVLPGVELGDFTIVGAGSVVTKPFPDGYCLIAGNPARKIKDLEREKCVRKVSQRPYVGYMRANEFDVYRRDFLWL